MDNNTREIQHRARHARHEFLDLAEEARADLWAHCRAVAGNPWDAEDLVQFALDRALAGLATESLVSDPPTPKELVFRFMPEARPDAPAPTKVSVDRPAPSLPVPILDFVNAFTARDLDALEASLRSDAEAEIVGSLHERGAGTIRNGWLRHTVQDFDGNPRPAEAPRIEEIEVDGEPVIALFYGEKLGDLLRFTTDDRRILLLRTYHFSPEVLTEIAEAMGVPVVTHGHCHRDGP